MLFIFATCEPFFATFSYLIPLSLIKVYATFVIHGLKFVTQGWSGTRISLIFAIILVLKQWFSTKVPWNPRTLPAESRGSARSYTNATIGSKYYSSSADMWTDVPWATGVFPWGSFLPKKLKTTLLKVFLRLLFPPLTLS